MENSNYIRIKKTKFVEMNYSLEEKGLHMHVVRNDGLEEFIEGIFIPINKIPQVIRGLFSCYQRFHRKKVRK